LELGERELPLQNNIDIKEKENKRKVNIKKSLLQLATIILLLVCNIKIVYYT